MLEVVAVIAPEETTLSVTGWLPVPDTGQRYQQVISLADRLPRRAGAAAPTLARAT